MIISASRRTDIPAFYSKWFMNRVREGWCHVPNPFNKKQITLVSLRPEEVEAVVFWTRNPRPLMPYLDELDTLGFRGSLQALPLSFDTVTQWLCASRALPASITIRLGQALEAVKKTPEWAAIIRKYYPGR